MIHSPLLQLFISSLLYSFASSQAILSTTSPDANLLYTFSISNDGSDIYLGRNASALSTATSSNFSSLQPISIPLRENAPFCVIIPEPFCFANVIDHIFLYPNNALICGSNGGLGGCFFYDLSTQNELGYQQIHLSGHLKADSSYFFSALYVNTETNVIYSQYFDDVASQEPYNLALFNFSNYTGDSPSFGDIPFITDTFRLTALTSATSFFNDPIVGKISRFSNTNTAEFDFIYFPYTETVLESPSNGLYEQSSRHGRLGRICANDLGQHYSPTNPVTYTKITIDCRDPTGVIRYPSDTSYVYTSLKQFFILDADTMYGFFTSQDAGSSTNQASAVCRFFSNRTSTNTSDNNIEQGFRSNYYNIFDGSTPISENSVNPWTCSDITTRDDGVGNLFSAAYQKLLHLTIVHNDAELIFEKHFESVVIDTVSRLTTNGLINITLFYATTFDGYLIKMRADYSISFVSQFKIADTALLNPEIREENGEKFLYSITTNQLYKTSLQLCYTYATALECFRDPECVWNVTTSFCVQYSPAQVYPTVPPIAILTVDDTCRLTIVSTTMTTITVSINCDFSLEMISMISITPLNSIHSSATSNTSRNATSSSVMIEFTGLLPLAGYYIMIARTNIYGPVPTLDIIAYTAYNAICPFTDTFSSIRIPSPEPSVALTTCITCSGNQFCIASSSDNVLTFPYQFPWDTCTLRGSLYSPQNSIATCDTNAVFTRCNSTSQFDHFDFSYIPTDSTIRVVLHDGFSFQELGIESYTFTLNGVGSRNISRETIFENLNQNTTHTVSFTANTLCGSRFTNSTEMRTLPNWPTAENCFFSPSGSEFQFNFINPDFCIGSNLSQCMSIVAYNCSVSVSSANSDNFTSVISGIPGLTCTIKVHPLNRPGLIGAFGCITRFEFESPVIFIITITTTVITPNSVTFNFSITPENVIINGDITLSTPMGSIERRQEIDTLLSSSSLTSGFQGLNENTVYKLQVTVNGGNESINFNTLSLPPSANATNCSEPIMDYFVTFQANSTLYNLTVEIDPACMNRICSGMLNETLDFSVGLNPSPMQYQSPTIEIFDLNSSISFAFLYPTGNSCPDIWDPSWRIILSDSLIPPIIITPPQPSSSTVIPQPPTTTVISSSIPSSVESTPGIVTSSLSVLEPTPSSSQDIESSTNIIQMTSIPEGFSSTTDVFIAPTSTVSIIPSVQQSATETAIPTTSIPTPNPTSIPTSIPTPTSTSIPTTTQTPTPTVAVGLQNGIATIAVYLFYLTIGVSVSALSASGIGLITLFVFIKKYPDLVEKKKAQNALNGGDGKNDIGLNSLNLEPTN